MNPRCALTWTAGATTTAVEAPDAVCGILARIDHGGTDWDNFENTFSRKVHELRSSRPEEAPFQALKGRHTLAQGNALGITPPKMNSLFPRGPRGERARERGLWSRITVFNSPLCYIVKESWLRA
jgi:hypothetical protein